MNQLSYTMKQRTMSELLRLHCLLGKYGGEQCLLQVLKYVN